MLSNNLRQLLREGVNDIVLVTFHFLDPKRSTFCILIKHMLSLLCFENAVDLNAERFMQEFLLAIMS